MDGLEQTFKGLADSNRLRILNLLLHDRLCVCEMHRALGLPQPNISRHLAYLKVSGLVVDHREGTRMFYQLARPGEGVRKRLFHFLQGAFAQGPVFAEDARRLQQEVRSGACKADDGLSVQRPSPAGRPRDAKRPAISADQHSRIYP